MWLKIVNKADLIKHTLLEILYWKNLGIIFN